MPPTRRAAYGVRSAQPTVTALRLCRDLIIVPPSHGRYGDLSAGVFEIFRSFTPHVEGLSLDEAFLDVSGLRRHYPTSTDVAIAVREEIRSRLGLPASVGIASSKFMAKLASEAAKPDGYRHIPKDLRGGIPACAPRRGVVGRRAGHIGRAPAARGW